MNKKIIAELLETAKKNKIEKIVVGAFIEKDGKILLLERPTNEFMGGIFELPSGNLENGEKVIEGLKREVKEETNLDVSDVVSFVDSFDYTSGSGKKVRQFNFYVTVRNGEITLSEHLSFAWASPEDKEYRKLTESVKKSSQKFYNLIGDKNVI